MIRVRDLSRSLAFYCGVLGMVERRREDYPEGKFTLVFLGYGTAENAPEIELTYNYGTADYSHGTGFGHIALAVEDIHGACARIDSMGGKVAREAGPMAHNDDATGGDIIAFVTDPDGYQIELIHRPQNTGPAPNPSLHKGGICSTLP
jgi:lactoylglutathione lyase